MKNDTVELFAYIGLLIATLRPRLLPGKIGATNRSSFMAKFRNLVAGLVALAMPAIAQSQTYTFNFDNLANQVAVPTNYGGGFWSGFKTAAGFGATSGPNIAYTSAPTGLFEWAAGFTSLTFSAGVFVPGTFDVYSGLGGTGTLLGSLTIGNPPADPNAFFPTSVAFSGVAMSVVVSGGAGQIGWDDVTINSVPEPASFLLVLPALGLVGVALQRRRKAIAS